MKNAIVFAVLLLLQTEVVQAGESSTDVCSSLKEKIERYQKLRRSGGSSKQMENWKQSLRKAEAKFRDNGCRK